MRALLLLFAATLLLSSCVTQEKCLEKFPPQITIKDSVVTKDSIVFRDTTVFLPGEKVMIRDFAYCDSLNRAQLPKTTVKGKHLTATVEIKDNKVSVDCNEDSLIAVTVQLREHIKTLEAWHSKTSVQVVKEYETHWYHTVSVWWMIISLLLIIGYLIISKLKK